MKTRRGPPLVTCSLRCGLLAASVLWVACGSDAAVRGPLRVCEEYTAAYDACFSRVSSDPETVARQVETMRESFAARAANPSARTQLAQSCSSALTRIQRSCPSGKADLTASTAATREELR
jgi:hypothetical protein